jgi:hypothetical protein
LQCHAVDNLAMQTACPQAMMLRPARRYFPWKGSASAQNDNQAEKQDSVHVVVPHEFY